jgi:hypothetical protein
MIEETNETITQVAQYTRDDIRIAYQSYPQMIAHEGSQSWEATSIFIQFSVTLVAVSIFPSYIFPGSDKVAAIVGLIFTLIGFSSSILWLSFIRRYEKISKYWVLSTRELEGHLADPVQAFQRGKDFSTGAEVKVSGEPLQYQGMEILPIRIGLTVIYIVFIGIFIILVIVNILRIIGIISI